MSVLGIVEILKPQLIERLQIRDLADPECQGGKRTLNSVEKVGV